MVKKIFAVGERLAGPRVKIIYEYDGKELDDQELTRKYREKYIPIEMNLTGISYQTLVEDLWDELGMGEVDHDSRKCSLSGLWGNIIRISRFATTTPYPLPSNTPLNFTEYPISVRRMRAYLLEIKAYLLSSKNIENSMLRTVVVFYFVKNFIPGIYSKLKVGRSLENRFSLLVNNEKYTLSELAEAVYKNKIKLETIEQDLKNPINHDSYLALCLFNYNYNAYRNVYIRRTANSTEAERNIVWLSEKERLTRIDCQISNLLENGESRISNINALVDKFKEGILSKQDEEQDEAWAIFQKELSRNEIYINSKGTLHSRPNYYVVLARAIATVSLDRTESNSFLAFVNKHWEGNQLDDDVIEFCETLVIRDIEYYKRVVHFFLKFAIIKDLTLDDLFKSFLKDFLTYFGMFLGIRLNIEGAFIENDSILKTIDGIESTIRQLKYIIERLKTIRPIYNNLLFRDDIDLYIRFVQKNIEILQIHEELMHERQNTQQQQETSGIRDGRVKDLMEILKECSDTDEVEEKFISKVDDYYNNRKINAWDVIMIKQKLDQWKEAHQKP